MTNTSSSLIVRLGLHFGLLFAVAFVAWAAFSVLRDGSTHLLPGIITAMVWSGLGTYIALRTGTRRDLRNRDTIEDYATRQVERTTARKGMPIRFRITRSRAGHPAGD